MQNPQCKITQKPCLPKTLFFSVDILIVEKSATSGEEDYNVLRRLWQEKECMTCIRLFTIICIVTLYLQNIMY
jgi:hypothetical protein